MPTTELAVAAAAGVHDRSAVMGSERGNSGGGASDCATWGGVPDGAEEATHSHRAGTLAIAVAGPRRRRPAEMERACEYGCLQRP